MASSITSFDSVAQFALHTAQAAGNVILASRDWELGFKGDRNLVTTADLQSQKTIVSAIMQQYPGHTVLAEEEGLDVIAQQAEQIPDLWVVDPLDGTTNFVYGHPYVAVSIAYLQFGVAQVGIVYSPFTKEIFSAVRGQGAFRNSSPIKCNDVANAREALVGTGFPYVRSNLEELSRQITAVIKECRDVRRNGAASLDLCSVACGRLDAYYETVEPWDMAAGALIAREAGVRVGSKPGPQGKFAKIPDLSCEHLLAASPRVFDKIAALIWYK